MVRRLTQRFREEGILCTPGDKVSCGGGRCAARTHAAKRTGLRCREEMDLDADTVQPPWDNDGDGRVSIPGSGTKCVGNRRQG